METVVPTCQLNCLAVVADAHISPAAGIGAFGMTRRRLSMLVRSMPYTCTLTQVFPHLNGCLAVRMRCNSWLSSVSFSSALLCSVSNSPGVLSTAESPQERRLSPSCRQ